MNYPLHIAICDDSPEDIANLQALLNKSAMPVICKHFSCGEDFLLSFKAMQYDLIFMDIYMKKLQGIETVKQIRDIDETVMIAFTTTSAEHTLESYRLGVLKYLEKPLTLKAIKETLSLALLQSKSRSSIVLPLCGPNKEMPLDGIFYFEQHDHIVEVHTVRGIYPTRQNVKLSEIELQLPSPPFIRCHHSYIVNLRYVQKLDEELKVFILKNGNSAYIRRGDLTKAKYAYEAYLFETTRGE